MMPHIALNIRKIREIKNIGQKFLATKLGISQSALSQLENGKVKITSIKLNQIAEALNVDANVLKNFNDSVAFNSCKQSGYINTNNINPIDKITELYEKIISQKDSQILELRANIEMLKNK